VKELDTSKKQNELLSTSFQLLKKVHSTKDLNLALGVEEFFLREELQKYSNSAEESGSLQKALVQLQEARQSYAVV
jgi:hypothetical protein